MYNGAPNTDGKNGMDKLIKYLFEIIVTEPEQLTPQFMHSLAVCGLPLDAYEYSVAIFDFSSELEDIQSSPLPFSRFLFYQDTISAAISNSFGGNEVCYSAGFAFQHVLLLCFQQRGDNLSGLKSSAARVASECARAGININIYTGRLSEKAGDLSAIYTALDRSIKFFKFTGAPAEARCPRGLSAKPKKTEQYLRDCSNKMAIYVAGDNYDKALALFSEIFDDLMHVEPFHVDRLFIDIRRFFDYLSVYLGELNVPNADFFHEQAFRLSPNLVPSAAALREIIISNFKKYFSGLAGNRTDKRALLLKSAHDYILEHISDMDLDVSFLCRKYDIHPSAFSTGFKKCMEKTPSHLYSRLASHTPANFCPARI